MPFYEKGDVRIRYEEAGSGFPLLLIPGGGLNSNISFLTGFAAGFVDSIAGGGGLITLPVLLSFGGDTAHLFGTNKVQATCGSASAAICWQKPRTMVSGKSK